MGLRGKELFKKLSLLFLLILVIGLTAPGGFAASDDVMINEIVYDPVGDETSGEWVEIYNKSGSEVDISGWTITDGNYSYEFPSDASITANSFLVVHTGDGTNTATNYYMDRASAFWNNNGDEVLLKDDGGNGVDYIAYGGDSGSKPADLSWTGDISGTAEGNSLALIPDGDDLDNADNWIPRSGSYITQGASNAEQPEPTLAININYPSGKDYVSTCKEATATIEVTNEDPAASIEDVEVVATLPDDFYYVTDNQGGNYDSGAHTVTWNGGISIAAGDTWSTTLTFKPNCTAASDQSIDLRADWAPYDGGSTSTVGPLSSDPINVNQVSLEITKSGYNESEGEVESDASSVVEASVSDTVVFLVEIENYGDGDAVGGATVEDVLGSGLSLNSIVDDTGNSVNYSGSGTSSDPYTWTTGPISAGESATFKVEATVEECSGLENQVDYSWGCSDADSASCSKTGSDSASIELVLKEPDLTYIISPSPIDIDYCSGATVTIDVTNGDPNNPNPTVGPARNYTLSMDGLPSSYSVTNVTGDATYDENQNEFIVGDIPPNERRSFSFDLEVDSCSPQGSGDLLFQSHYTNDCDKDYSPPTKLDSFSLSNVPSISIEKTGQRSVDVGETGISYPLELSYEGPDKTLTIVDDYPDTGESGNDYGDFEVSDPAGGDVSGGEIEWTENFSDGDTWSKTIQLDAPTNACAAGNTYTNQLSFSPTNIDDCKGCTIDNNSPADYQIYVNNDDENAITDHSKIVNYLNVNSNGATTTGAGSAEDGTEIKYTTTVQFSDQTGSAPGQWDGIVFTEEMEGGQTYDSVDSIEVDGTSYSDYTITSTSGTLKIDLSDLDNGGAPVPNSGATLTLVYKLNAPDGSEGSFIDWSHLEVPGYPKDCGGDPTYDQGVDVSISETSLGTSVSGPSLLDKCGTETFTINVSKNSPFQAYDALATLDTNGYYDYIDGSVSFSGLEDEDGNTISTFNPTVDGDQLKWNLGDLSSGGTIQVDLKKKCSPTETDLNSIVGYNDNPDNVIPDSDADSQLSSREKTSTGSYTASALREGELDVVVQPETYNVRTGYPRFRVYVINRGDGALYDVQMDPLDFGTDLEYYDHSVASGVGITSFTGSPGDGSVSWTYDEIPPGKKSVVTFTGELTGCSPDQVTATGDWCTSCSLDLSSSDTMDLFLSASDVVVVSHSMTPSVMDYCGDTATFTMEAKNFGKTSVYQAQIQANLAQGLSLNSNFTPEYSTDGGTTWSDFPGEYTEESGNDYTWDFADPNGDGNKSDALLSSTDRDGKPVLASGETISIRYEAQIADCTAASSFENGTKTTTALSNFDRPCNHTNTGAPGSSSDPNDLTVEGAEPHVSITKQGRNDTKGTSYTTGTVESESGDTVEWKIEITSDGNYRAKNVTIQDILPANVSFDSWSQDSGINLTKTSDYEWHVDRNDDGWSSVSSDDYLEEGESAVFTVYTTVDSCTDSNTTNESTVSWGCCSVDEDSESDSVDLKTVLNPTDVDVSVDKSDCTTCGGKVTVDVSNPTTDVLSLYDLELVEELPDGYIYDDSKDWGDGDTGTKVTFSGWSSRTDDNLTWDEGEEEPDEDTGTLTWASSNNGGNIPNDKALLGPGETIKLEFYIKNDGTYVDNDTNSSTEPDTSTGDRNDNDPDNPDYDVPAISNTFTVSGDDSCGNSVGTTSGYDSVDPAQPDVDVTIIPDKPLVTSGDTVTWTVTLSNDGSADASNISLELDPGPDGSSSGGYTSTDVTQNAPSGYSAGDDPISWDPADIGTLAPGDTYVIKLEGTVGSSGGDLSITGHLEGECTDVSGTGTGHLYTIDYTKNYVAGLIHDKTFKNVNEPGEITDADTDATSSIGNVVSYEISLDFLSSGDYSNVTLTDDLDNSETGSADTRVEYLSGSFTTGTGSITDNNDGTITIEPGGGSFSGPANFVIEVKVNVKDISSVQGSEPAASPTKITDNSDLSFDYGGRSYESSNPDYEDLLLEDDTQLTIVEPYVDDSNFQLGSVSPPCGSQVTEDDTIAYQVTFKNTGNGPLYDAVYRHDIDTGMRDNSATVNEVSVDGGAGNARTLTQGANEDYEVTANTPGDDYLELTFQNTDAAAIAPGETVTVSYTLTVNSGIGAGVSLDDTIKLDQYTSLPGNGTVTEENGQERVSGFNNQSPGYPLDPLSCQHTTAGLSASKSVQSDVTSPTSEQTTPDTDPSGGTTSSLTIGEAVLYRISTTVPAGTTAYDVTFSDTVADGLTVTDVTCTSGSCSSTSFSEDTADGTWDVSAVFGDVSGGTGGQDLTVKITARVDKTFSSDHVAADYPPNGEDWSLDDNDNGVVDAGDHLANRGTYSWAKNEGGSKTDAVSNTTDTIIKEPNLTSLAKSIDKHYDSDGTTEVDRGTNTFYWYEGGSQQSEGGVPIVLPNDELVFEVTVENTGDTTAYDIDFQDQLPSGLIYQTNTIEVSASSGSDPSVSVSSETPLEFNVDQLDSGATLTVNYRVKVDTGLGAGQYLDNSVEVEDYSTLPAGSPNESYERDTDTTNGYSDLGPVSSPVGVQYPTLEKNLYRYRDDDGKLLATPEQINDGDVRIGERLQYEVIITLPRHTKLYEGSDLGHVIIEDQLPGGFSRIDGNDILNSGDIDLTLDSQSPNPSGPGSDPAETWNWYFDTVTNSTDSESTAALQFDVRVTDEDNTGATLYQDNSTSVDVTNEATLYWDTVDSGEGAKDDPSLNTTQGATVTQPDLTLDKSSSPSSGSVVIAGESIDYTLNIENEGSGISYNISLFDTLPSGTRAGFSLDSVEIQDGSGTTLRTLASGEDFTESYDQNTGELDITTNYDSTNSDYDSRVEPGEVLVVNYSTTVDSEIGAGRVGSRALVNEAEVSSYYSLRSGIDNGERKEYGPVGPERTKLSTPLPELEKTQTPASGGTVDSGESLSYTITVPKNALDATLYSPQVEDTVPDGLSLDTITVSGGTNSNVTENGRDFVVDFDEIGGGNQATITVDCTVNSGFDDGSSIQPGHEFVNDARVEWYDAPSSDTNRRTKIVSSNEVRAFYQGAAIKLVPGHTSEAFPGGTVTYRHELSNLGSESDTVTINYGPSTRNWNWILYRGDGSGNINTGAGPIGDGDTLTLDPDATQELIARAFVPADTPTGSQDVLEITAQGTNNSASVTDITIVRRGKMDLTKELKVNGGSWTTDAEGSTGDTVTYRLSYENISTINLSNVRIIDSLPDHTSYKSGTATIGNQGSYSIEYSIDGGISWNSSEPSDLTNLTHIKWVYDDAPLLPGETGYVTYEVEIK